MYHEEHMGETCAKVDAIDVVMAGGLGGVDIAALGTVKLHHGLSWYI